MPDRTLIRYNNVVLANCLTERFVEEPVYDDSGTDLLYFKYRITVVCYVHGDHNIAVPTQWNNAPFDPLKAGQSAPGISNYEGIVPTAGGIQAAFPGPSGAVAGQLAVLNYRRLREALTEPRGRFQMWVGDNQILRATSALNGAPGGAAGFITGSHDPVKQVGDEITSHDLNNGPKILECEIDKIQGPHIFRVRWSVEVCLLHCEITGSSSSAEDPHSAGIGGFRPNNNRDHVLSNRWTVEDRVDENLETTRTYRGVLRTTTAMINPNQFRSYCLPPLSMGMRRDSMSFATSMDSLTLSYTIVDKEVAFSAPFPALDWDFRWGVSAGDGKIGVAEGSVRLRGHRNTKKGHLMQLGLEILESRLQWKAKNAGGKVRNFIEQLTIEDIYGSSANEIHVSARVRLIGEVEEEAADGFLPLPFRQALTLLGVPIDNTDTNDHSPNYDRDWSPQGAGHHEVPGVLAEGLLPLAQAFSCALQEICRQTPLSLGQNTQRPDLPQKDYAANEPKGTDIKYVPPGSDDIKTQRSRFSDQHHQAPYLDYHATAEFAIPEMTVPTPIAGPMNQPVYSPGGGSPIYSYPADASTVAVSLTKPQCKYIVTVMAERIGETPVLPKMQKSFSDHNGIEYTLHAVNPQFAPPQLGTNGEERHALYVRYDYIMNRPPVMPGSARPGTEEDFLLPEIPWLTGGNNTIYSSPHQGRRIASKDVFKSDFTT